MSHLTYVNLTDALGLGSVKKAPLFVGGAKLGSLYAARERRVLSRAYSQLGRWNWFRWFAYGASGGEGEALRLSWLSCRAMLLSSSVARISLNRSITAVSALI